MLTFKHKGDFSKTTNYFKRIRQAYQSGLLERYAQEGVDALASATPVDTGETASSWYYKIRYTSDTVKITFSNSNNQNGVPIAILLQYGHATRNGGWVQGRDYINPAIQPIFDRITQEVWKEVAKS